MLPRGPKIEFWTCFPKVRWFGILDVLPRGPRIEFWTCFPEVRWFEVRRASQRSDGLKFGRASQRSDGLNLDMLPRGPLKLNFGRAFQRSDGLEGIIHTDVCGPFTLILHASMSAEGG